jgi:hypothetical protein
LFELIKNCFNQKQTCDLGRTNSEHCNFCHLLSILKSLLPCAVILAISFSLVTGCTTNKSPNPSAPPGSGIAEYKQMTAESTTAVEATLHLLDKITAQSDSCPRKLVDAFSTQVQKMQVASIRIRARAQAIQTRGDAFFQDWHESLSRINDPELRDRAQRFKPELERSFKGLKLASQQAREAYKNFSSGLLAIQCGLENDPKKVQLAETQQLLQATRNHGEEVLQHLATIQAELHTMSDLLAPSSRTASL